MSQLKCEGAETEESKESEEELSLSEGEGKSKMMCENLEKVDW